MENEMIPMPVDPLVSVIVPVYGTEAWLPECIDSIRKQTYTAIEILLVDDASPDRCPEICDACAQEDPRIRVIHQRNTGVSGARNTGIRHARGAYLMFVDSDDALYPDAVTILMQDAMTHGADIVSAKKDTIDVHGKRLSDHRDRACRVFRGEEGLVLSLDGEPNTNSVCAKLFRRAFVDGILFAEGKNVHEDGFFLFQCCLRQPVLVQHDFSVYGYKIRAGSGSRGGFSEKYLAMLDFCEEKKRLVSRHYPQYMDRARNMEVRTHLQLLDLLCRTNDPKYKTLQKRCVKTVRRLYPYLRPINRHHKQLARIVKFGLYPLYKFAVRMKYHHSPEEVQG